MIAAYSGTVSVARFRHSEGAAFLIVSGLLLILFGPVSLNVVDGVISLWRCLQGDDIREFLEICWLFQGIGDAC
jgi:hypothetical protein